MEGLHPAVASWFHRQFAHPTPAQEKAVPIVLAGENLLLSSPTGSGKTLAAFLAVLSRLHDEQELGDRTLCVYVSPLKALAADVARNLAWPLRGISEELGRESPVRVALRHGETSRADRERMVREVPHILVTTPESLALVLASPRWEAPLRHVRHVIVDEVHDLAATKRGAHLALTLERLGARCDRPPQRIGLSATVRPLDEAARFLCGKRPCRLEEARPAGPCDLRVGLPVPDPLRARGSDFIKGLERRLVEAIEGARTTIVFTNTRAAAEATTLRLRALLGEDLLPDADDAEDPEFDEPRAPSAVAPHHGSMSRDERNVVEARLVAGDLRCVVTSSSLELGVHVEAADQVMLLGSPKLAARGLQRVGRSGHGVGREARGLLLATDPDELLEAAALASLVRAREVEPLVVPEGGLDVLAQHLVALGLDGAPTVDEALALTRRAWPYRDLAREDLEAVLRHLESIRLVRHEGARFASRGGLARMTLAKGGGAIPRGGLCRVVCDGRFVGEVEEAFAETLQEGSVFQLGGRAWRYVESAGRTIRVREERREPPNVPEWRGEGLSASPLVADAMARRVFDPEAFESDDARRLLERVLDAQRRFLGDALAESFVDDAGRRALVIHAPLGRRATDALGRALLPRWTPAGRFVSSELGVALVGPRAQKATLARVRHLFAEPLSIPDLEKTDVFQRRFRQVTERALLIPEDEASLRSRQRFAERVLDGMLREDPDHPLVRETRREVLRDALDLARAEAFRRDAATRVRLVADRPCASPLGACIATPRAGGVASFERLAHLREALERCEEWLDERNVPRQGRLENGEAAPRNGA